MTWNPLKRTYLTAKPTWAPEVINKTDDKELDVMFHRLQHLEEVTKRLQKEMKKYIDGMQVAHKAEQKIAADLSSSIICQQNMELCTILGDYHSVTSKGCDSISELTNTCQHTFQEPLKKFGNYFSGIDVAYHKREQLLQEWRNAATKVRKLEERERTATNVMKLDKERKAMENAGKELACYHNTLLSEVLQFYRHRIDYIQPILQALVRAQIEYHGNLTRLFTLLVTNSDVTKSGSPSSTIPESELRQSVESKLSQIRALSIVK